MIVKLNRLLRLGRREEGAAALEFALCLIPLLLIVGGIIDFGHLWYMEALVAHGSREGARYATRYNDAKAPSTLTDPSVKDFVLKTSEENGGKGGFGLASLLPSDANPDAVPGGTGYTVYMAGSSVSVKVSADKYWLFLNNFIPVLTNPQHLESTTIMSLE
jgi:Flp pilus assembly protein TadG